MNKPKPAESLKEFILTDKNCEEAKLGSTLFLRKPETWSSIETTVRDYFTLTETHAPTPRPLYNKVLEALDNISQEVKIKKVVKTYCQKLLLYYKNNASKLVFFEKYEDLDRELRKQKPQQTLDDENNIAGNIMVAQMLKELSSSMLRLSPPRNSTQHKRRRQDAESDEITSQELENSFIEKKSKPYFAVNKFSKLYNMQKPSGFITSPNKPTLQEVDIQQLKQFANIYTSNIKSATRDLEDQYDELMKNQYLNKSLKINSEHYTHALAISKISNMNALEEYINGITPVDIFTKFLKYAANDYYINCLRIRPYATNDERTIYCEVIIPIFKIFGNITGEIVHVWCEKAQPESKALCLQTHDYSLKGFDKKLLDGIGTLAEIPRTYLIFESPGYDKAENVDHNIKNNIKNMKSATDALKYCACRYKFASYVTFMKAHLFLVHVIQNKMTLTRYSYNASKKFDIVEARSYELPLAFVDSRKFLKLMEFFAYLYNDLQKQKDVFDQLSNEQNGIIGVEETEMVKNMLR